MLSLFDQMRKKRLLRRYMLFLSAVIVFHSVIYYPIYLMLASDVVWKNSIFFFLWTEIAEPLAAYLFFWGSFAYLIYAGVRFSRRATGAYLAVYLSGTVLRYALQNVCFMIMMGFPAWKRSLNLAQLLLSLLLDMLVMGVVYAIFLLLLRYLERQGKAPYSECLPLGGFFELKNPLIKVLAVSALIPEIARIITRAYYDIRMILFEQISPSGPAEILLMVTYYLTDILTALLGYLVIFVMVSSFHLSDFKAKMRFEEKS